MNKNVCPPPPPPPHTHLVFLLVGDGGRFLVKPNAKALELLLDDALVREGLEAVQHDEDEVACAGGGDDLTGWGGGGGAGQAGRVNAGQVCGRVCGGEVGALPGSMANTCMTGLHD